MATENELHYMERVREDVERCRRFVGRDPTSQAAESVRHVTNGIHEVWENPELQAVAKHHPDTGVEFRCHYVSQFAIVYAYFPPTPSTARGLVSIRAVRYEHEGRFY